MAVLAAVTMAVVLPETAGARPSRARSSRSKTGKVKKAKTRQVAAKPAPAPRPCQYGRGGSVLPLCRGGSGIRNTWVEGVPGTNIVVNKAWVPTVSAFVGAARQAGFNLQAWDNAGHGYGSFRTAAMQSSLRRRGYPANPVGTSMHEWGLAIDFSCNGAKFLEAPPPCRNWVRAYAPYFGIYNLPSEPWHWSSNGT